MPRNDQMIRQLHLLRELESLRGKLLGELTSALPKDYTCHERTVRRDLEALESAGFPLITETINGQTRWRFIDGYRNTLALGFSPSEIIALRLTRQLLAPLEGTGIQESLQHTTQNLTPLKSGELTMTLTVADNRELVGWILSFGSGVRVIEPGLLRQAIRQEAKAIAAQPEDVQSQPLPLPSPATRRVNRQTNEGRN